MSLSINSNKSSKSLLANSQKILKIKNYLKIDILPKPFDGYVTNRKKFKIIDFIKKKDKPPYILSNKVNEEKTFPLLELISNRQSVNRTKNFLRNILHSKEILSPLEENSLSHRTFRQPKLLKNRFTIKSKVPEDNFEKKKEFSLDKVRKTILVNFKKNISTNKGKRELSNFNKKKINQKLVFHNISKSNKLFLDYDKKNNYILNDYKNLEEDKFISLIQKDVAHLRFRNHIKSTNVF